MRLIDLCVVSHSKFVAALTHNSLRPRRRLQPEYVLQLLFSFCSCSHVQSILIYLPFFCQNFFFSLQPIFHSFQNASNDNREQCHLLFLWKCSNLIRPKKYKLELLKGLFKPYEVLWKDALISYLSYISRTNRISIS